MKLTKVLYLFLIFICLIASVYIVFSIVKYNKTLVLYDTDVINELIELNKRVSVLESTNARLLMIIYNENKKYRDNLIDYLAYYCDSNAVKRLRQGETIK